MRRAALGLMLLAGVAWAGPPSVLHEPQMGTFEPAEPLAVASGAFILGLAPDGRVWRGIPPADLTGRNAEGGVVWALSLDRTYALGVHAENRGDLITLRLLRLSDPDQVEPEELQRWGHGQVDAALEPHRLWAMTTNVNRITHYAAVRADGALCYPTFRRIACFHADGRVESALEAAELTARIAPDAPRRDRVALYRARGTATGGEFYSGLGASPDGSLYAYLHATVDWERAPDFPEESLQYVREVGWVIRLAPDGAVWPLANPIVQRHAYVPGVIDQTIFFPGLLRNVSHVTWSPRLDAAMVWPVEHLDFTWVDFGDRLTAGGVGPAIPPTGWGGGAGAAFFPVAGEGDGYQTWREALIREARDGQCVPDTVLNSSLAGCMGLTVVPVPAADGRLGVVRLAEGGFQFRGLDLNGSQDLDGDGLSAEAEAGLGTSDFLADSDGGGVQDRHEIEFFGTDPLTPGDDPGRASRLAGPRVYDSSPLVQLRLPERIAQTGTAPLLARSLSNRGPVCVQGRCYDAAGAVVSDYSDHPRQLEDGPANAQTVSRIRVPEVKSADGQFLVLQDNQGLTRHDLADGRRTLWVPWARLLEDFPIDPARFGSAALMQVFPVDRDRLFVAWDDGRLGEPARVVRYDGAGQGTRVFDLAALCAQAGLPCTLDFRENALRQDLWLGHFEVIGWSEPLQRLLLRVWTRFDMPILGVDADGDVARVEGLYENLAQVTLAEQWQAQPPFPVVDAFRAQIRPGEWFTGQDVIDAGEVAQPAQLGILPVYGAPFGGWGDSLLHYHYTQRAEGLFEIVPVPLDLAPGDVLFFANLEFSDPEGADRPMLFRLNRRGGIAPVWTEYKGVARGTGLDVNAAFEVCVADGEQVVLFAPDGSTGNRPEAEQGRWTLPGVSDCQLVDGQVLALVGEQVFRLNGEAFEATGETAQAFYRDPQGRPARLAVGEDLWEVLVPEGLPEGVTPTDGPLVRRPDGLVFHVAPGRFGVSDPRITALNPRDGRAVAMDLRRVWGPMAYSIVSGGDDADPWARADNTGQPVADPGGSPDGGVGPGGAPRGDDGGCRAGPGPGHARWLGLLVVVGGLLRRRRYRLNSSRA